MPVEENDLSGLDFAVDMMRNAPHRRVETVTVPPHTPPVISSKPVQLPAKELIERTAAAIANVFLRQRPDGRLVLRDTRDIDLPQLLKNYGIADKIKATTDEADKV